MTEKPATMPWRCRFGLHRWGRWSDLIKYDYLMPRQRATCLRCNKIKGRTL